ncbi:MAG: PqqD family protein [Desulforhopalus sp.]
MKDSQRFRLSSEFKIEKFDNEILLYAISSARGIYLNQTAYLVWELCAQNHSIAEIIAFLQETYPQQKEYIREDVITSIESLVETEAIIIDNG